jgi:DNA-binding transcriptional MocR family regulator
MLPDALDDVCSRENVAAVHLQPTLDNPRGRTMPRARREALAAAARRRDLWVIEDDPLGPLVPDRPEPLAALVPDRTCHIASAAKVLALGLRVGILSAPDAAFPRLAAALRASTWLSAPLLGELFSRWVGDGTAERIVQQRLVACHERNTLARDVLAGLDLWGDAGSPHVWLELPAPWSAGSFVAAAREAGVLVASGDDHVVDRIHPAFGVRIGLNADVPDDQLRRALVTLERLVPAGPTST